MYQDREHRRELLRHVLLAIGADSVGSDRDLPALMDQIWRESEGRSRAETRRMAVEAVMAGFIYGRDQPDLISALADRAERFLQEHGL